MAKNALFVRLCQVSNKIDHTIVFVGQFYVGKKITTILMEFLFIFNMKLFFKSWQMIQPRGYMRGLGKIEVWSKLYFKRYFEVVSEKWVPNQVDFWPNVHPSAHCGGGVFNTPIGHGPQKVTTF